MTGERWWAPVLTAALALTLTVTPDAMASPASSRDRLAPLHLAAHDGVAHHYIVVLKGRLPAHPTRKSERRARRVEERVAASVGAKPDHDYLADLFGFAAHLTRSQVHRLRQHPKVKYVEQDALVTEDTTQTGASWGLDRIDQRELPGDGTYTYESDGAGVDIYVLDTGILTTHSDFGTRARVGTDTTGTPGTDCNGHGTHVAGIAGGTRYGVAKGATLVSVRVLNCQGSGTITGVIAGLDWVEMHHAARSVANMSLGGGTSSAMNAAVRDLVASGVFVAVAAGNNNALACNYSPAGESVAFTVAASDNTDRKASYSNHGTCVDAYAPGSQITSDWIGSTSAINTISGTSMAAPAVAGVAALYLASNPTATPADITQWLISNATTNVIVNNPVNTSNRLLFMGGL